MSHQSQGERKAMPEREGRRLAESNLHVPPRFLVFGGGEQLTLFVGATREGKQGVRISPILCLVEGLARVTGFEVRLRRQRIVGTRTRLSKREQEMDVAELLAKLNLGVNASCGGGRKLVDAGGWWW